jgi:hypothetical protein
MSKRIYLEDIVGKVKIYYYTVKRNSGKLSNKRNVATATCYVGDRILWGFLGISLIVCLFVCLFVPMGLVDWLFPSAIIAPISFPGGRASHELDFHFHISSSSLLTWFTSLFHPDVGIFSL